jgi:hypothetical protein
MEQHNHTREFSMHNFASTEELYSSITKEGSLGLLALGSQGLLTWRQKRAELYEVFPPTTESEMVAKLTNRLGENEFE